MVVVERSATVERARAEALHVDGVYLDAARLWAGLAESGDGDACDAKLREATAWLCLDDIPRGMSALDEARQLGAPSGAVLHVRAQYAVRQRDWRAAENLLREALEDVHNGRLVNALGVALWRLGNSSAARDAFETALTGPASDALAGVNVVALALSSRSVLGDAEIPRLEAMLARAAEQEPHRPEPHVLLSRLRPADRRGLALARARLRSRRLGVLADDTLARWAGDPVHHRSRDRDALRALARTTSDSVVQAAIELVRDGRLCSGYDFMALLSWERGQSLTWLENQRVHVEEPLRLSAIADGSIVRCVCELVLPEGPVDVTLLREGRELDRRRVSLALGVTTIHSPGAVDGMRLEAL